MYGSMMMPMVMAAACLSAMVTIAALVVVAYILATRRRPVLVASAESPALRSAKERYARGEIDRVELERLLDAALRADGHDRALW